MSISELLPEGLVFHNCVHKWFSSERYGTRVGMTCENTCFQVETVLCMIFSQKKAPLLEEGVTEVCLHNNFFRAHSQSALKICFPKENEAIGEP
jgi:hypothetical protein